MVRRQDSGKDEQAQHPEDPERRHGPDILGERKGDLLIETLVGRILTHVVDDLGVDG